MLNVTPHLCSMLHHVYAVSCPSSVLQVVCRVAAPGSGSVCADIGSRGHQRADLSTRYSNTVSIRTYVCWKKTAYVAVNNTQHSPVTSFTVIWYFILFLLNDTLKAHNFKFMQLLSTSSITWSFQVINAPV